MHAEDKKAQISALRYIATQNYENTRTDAEIRADNVTDLFWKEIDMKVKHGELINIQICGQVASGKSTAGIYIAWRIAKKHLKVLFDDKSIDGDQVEFLKVIRNPTIGNCIRVIDEWNQLGETGFNATTEQAMFTYISNVQAQRYIHKVSCSPTEIVDPNADIILEIISKDPQYGTTTALVSYRIQNTTGQLTQLVGYAIFNVSKLLREDFYKRYREKKFRKMDFVIKEGIRDIREIQFAKIIVRVYNELKEVCKVMTINKDVITNYVESKRRQDQELFSILTGMDLVSKVNGLLAMEKQISKSEQMLAKETNPTKVELIANGIDEMKKVRDESLANYQRLIDLEKNYNSGDKA